MAYTLTNLPTDLSNYIGGLVKDLELADANKAKLKQLAIDCVNVVKIVFGKKVVRLDTYVAYTWMDSVLDGDDDDYVAAVEEWNKFVDDHEHLQHLLSQRQQKIIMRTA